MEISQIEGLQESLDLTWNPELNILLYSHNATTHKSKYQIIKKRSGSLKVLHPVTKVPEEVTIIPDTGYITQELNARDATNPFIVVFTYDIINKTIVLHQGAPGDIIPPYFDTSREVKIGQGVEVQQGSENVPPVVEPANFFKTRALTKAAGTYTDVIDFQYSVTNLTLTGNITINAPANITGDSLPTGKIIMLRVAASTTYAITWGSAFRASKTIGSPSVTSGDINAYSIWFDEISGKYLRDVITY